MQGRVAPERPGFEPEQTPSEGELRQSLDMCRWFRLGRLTGRSRPLLGKVLEDVPANIGGFGQAWRPSLGGRELLRSELGEETKQLCFSSEGRSLFRRDQTVACRALISVREFRMLFRRQGHIDPPSCDRERAPPPSSRRYLNSWFASPPPSRGPKKSDHQLVGWASEARPA